MRCQISKMSRKSFKLCQTSHFQMAVLNLILALTTMSSMRQLTSWRPKAYKRKAA